METYQIKNNYGTGTFKIRVKYGTGTLARWFNDSVSIVESEPVVGSEYKGEKITAVARFGYAEDTHGSDYELYVLYEIETVTQYGWDDPSEEAKSTYFVAVKEPLDIPEDEE